MENEFDFTPGKPVAFRPTAYDVGILASIHDAHPELKDTGDLIRKALREYQIARDGGGMKLKVGKILNVVLSLPSMLKTIMADLNYIKARVEQCESVKD